MIYLAPNVNGAFYFNQLITDSYVSLINAKIRKAYPNFSSFNATTAYTITWSAFHQSKSILYQAVLCTNMKNSFMLVSYEKLGIPFDQESFYVDTLNHSNAFHPSTNESNCAVAGQFIFQFNFIPKQHMIGFNLKLYTFNLTSNSI
jgi:hypothetical protein